MPTSDPTPPVTTPRAGRRPGRLLASGSILALAVGVGVAGTAIVDGRSGGTPTGDGSRVLDRSTPIAFRSFDDCTALLGYFRTHAGKLVTANGLPGLGGGLVYPMAMERAATDSVGGAAAGAPAPAAAPNGAVDTAGGSGTNVQVAGVDEGDVVKRSGDLLLTVVDGRLRVARLAGSTVTMLGSLVTDDGTGSGTDAWTPNQLLVDGDTVLMVGSVGGRFRPLDDVSPSGTAIRGLMPLRPMPTKTRIAQVDLSDPAKPVLVRTLDVDGNPSGVRLVDGIARIAVTSDPQGPRMQYPQYGMDPSASQTEQDRAFKALEKKALTANRAAVARSTVDAWLPHYTLTERTPGGAVADTSTGRLLECDAIAAPESFSGLSTVALLNLDLRSPSAIGSWAGAGVVASGGTLYATADHVYLATSPWIDWTTLSGDALVSARTRQRTQIHLFDSTDSTAPRYVGSGEVPGFLLGQFAMDEYQGRLRVASTDQPQFLVGGPAVDVPAGAPGGIVDDSTASTRPEQSHSLVSVLELERNRLSTVGVVDGLGKGEQIRAVRFIGPVGYVVTFRQTDPLYTVDLSTPARPRVAGELKILGYSAYLHPVGEGLLLGLGQDADKQGRTSGLQLSLFDVRDPANPVRVSTRTVPGAWSDVEGDHHAFTYTDGLALAPYTGYTEMPSAQQQAEDPAAGSDGSTGSGVSPGSTGAAGYPVQVFDTGVLAVPVQGDRLGAAARLRPLADGPLTLSQQPTPKQDRVTQAVPMRTVVNDGYIYTVTPIGIAVHVQAGLDRIGFIRF